MWKRSKHKKDIKLSSVSEGKSSTIKVNILNAAKIRSNCIIESRSSSGNLDLHAVQAQHHLSCYQIYFSEGSLSAFSKEPSLDVEKIHDNISCYTYIFGLREKVGRRLFDFITRDL